MGANQSNVPTGTKWSDIQKDRKRYQDVELPDIPYNKMKEVCVEIDNTVKESKYLKEYKREIRDALKRKCSKGHSPKLFRLQDKCFHPADEAAGKGNTRKDMCQELGEGIAMVIKDDVIDALKEEGKGGGNVSKEADSVIHRLVYERMIDQLMMYGERIFKKNAKGQNADESDPELSEEALAKEEEHRMERKRNAAEKREAEAEAWKEEQDGGGAKTAAAAAAAQKAAEDSGDEEEDDDEDDEE